MRVRSRVLVGAGRSLLVLLLLAGCDLLFPYPRVTIETSVIFDLEVPIYRCQPGGFQKPDHSVAIVPGPANFEVMASAPSTGHPAGQGLDVGQVAYVDRNWTISSIDQFAVDPALWPDRAHGPNWVGADWIRLPYEASTNTPASYLSIEMNDRVRALYVAVDRSVPTYPGFKDEYVQMARADKPGTPQVIKIDRPDSPLVLEIWKSKNDPRDAAQWHLSARGKPNWMAKFNRMAPQQPADYFVILEPESAYDCGSKAYTPDRALPLLKHHAGPFPKFRSEMVSGKAKSVDNTPQAREDARAQAMAAGEKWIREQSGYPGGSLTVGPITIVSETEFSVKTEALTQPEFEFQPWTFTYESLIQFDPAKFTSVADITFLGKNYKTHAKGPLHFHYVMDGSGAIPRLQLSSLRMDLDPLVTPDGTFKNVSVTMLAPAEATCTDPPPLPWHQPGNQYSVPAQTLVFSLMAEHDKGPILLTARNRGPVVVSIDHKNRTVQFSGGPLSSSILVDGQPQPVDVSVSLTGVFENFAPVALTAESKTTSECQRNGTNLTTLSLDASASFKIYGDPLPTNPAQYSWFERYGGVTERLWGQGKKVLIPPGKIGYGVHPVTLLLRDNHGAVDTRTVSLVVHDTLPPTLNSKPDVVRLVRHPDTPPVRVELDPPTVFDNGTFSVAVTNNSPPKALYQAGTTDVTWSADDGHGNVTKKVQHVAVVVVPEKIAPPVEVLGFVEAILDAFRSSATLTTRARVNPGQAAQMESMRGAVTAVREALAETRVPDGLIASQKEVVRDLDAAIARMTAQAVAGAGTGAAGGVLTSARTRVLPALARAADVVRRASRPPRP